MRIVNLIDHLLTDQPTILNIGKFDGVHIGHQRLISLAIEQAHAQKWLSAVLTFNPHPDLVLHPPGEQRLLTSPIERTLLIDKLKPDLLIIAPFTPTVMATSAFTYMQQICTALPLRELWVGEGFALGREREGNLAQLEEIGKMLGYRVKPVPAVELDGLKVSTSLIRQLLQMGKVEQANRLLGRPFALEGVVVAGERRGREIGFPTANLAVENWRLLPADGVYACKVCQQDELLLAITNIGIRPTFGGFQPTLETHLLDWQGDLYGQILQVQFLQRLRHEQKFGNIAELKAQLTRDAAQTRALLG